MTVTEAPAGEATPDEPPSDAAGTAAASRAPRKTGLVRRIFMRPRKVLVRVHRWLSFLLLAWLVIISLTGAWLVESKGLEALLHRDRYATTDGDVGADAAEKAAKASLPDGATVYGVALPRDGRGVYQVGAEMPAPGAPEPAEGEEPEMVYKTVLVDPGSGKVNAALDEEEGFTNWMYRGHMYLWQDQGIAAVFNPESGWCRKVGGAEPGGAKGVVCDVLPDGGDFVGWFAVAWIVVLLSGFYLWYWPGVKRWAKAFAIQRGRGRFAFHLSVHKAVGLVVWVPLVVVAFTGAAFAFPNMKAWYTNATPAERDFALWEAPEEAYVSGDADGREPLGLDGFTAALEEQYPNRAVQYVMPPADETGTYTAWMTRGFDPWTREGGAGNVYVAMDQYSGKVLYDGTPEEGNAFDQAWDDWSFPLHTGDWGGWITRLIWVVLALSPLVLGVTGTVMWLVRRSKRKQRAVRSPRGPLVSNPT